MIDNTGIGLEELDMDDFLGSLLINWYEQWLEGDGEKNPVLEQVKMELQANT